MQKYTVKSKICKMICSETDNYLIDGIIQRPGINMQLHICGFPGHM